MTGPYNAHRDWGRVDQNTPRHFFDWATRQRVEPVATWIQGESLVGDLERMLQAEAARQARMRAAQQWRQVQRGDPGA